jgi:hypothetical protein
MNLASFHQAITLQNVRKPWPVCTGITIKAMEL